LYIYIRDSIESKYKIFKNWRPALGQRGSKGRNLSELYVAVSIKVNGSIQARGMPKAKMNRKEFGMQNQRANRALWRRRPIWMRILMTSTLCSGARRINGLISMRSQFLSDLLATKDFPANRKLTPSAASTGKRVVRGSIDEYLSTGW
jgi:hypothetical protein